MHFCALFLRCLVPVTCSWCNLSISSMQIYGCYRNFYNSFSAELYILQESGKALSV